MDDTTLSSLAVDIADSYAPPPMPTAPEITWEFDDPEIAEALGEDFTKSESPGNYFVKETSPVLTDPGTYFSTENFIKRVDGFEPKKQAVNSQQPNNLHFGDSMKQMDFVRRQMVNLTGLAFLEDHIDYTQEIKNLYEKGIKYGKDMKLSAGVSLSQDQVDALQDDMVWAEEIQLRGTKVVIPRLYLAKSKRDKKASGLLARNIDIDAGSIINNGSSIVGENVSLKAHSGDIINKEGGDIYGSNYLGLYASRDIKNVGSSIASGGSMLMSAGRNIENITESQRYGDAKNHVTTIGKQSTIKAKGPLALFSGNDLLNKGSSIKSGDLEFTVHGNMINDSIEDSYSSEMIFSNGHRKEKSVVYKPATISSSGSTKGFVAGNFALIGSRMSSTGDSEINVGGKSMLTSQVNSKMLDTHSEYTTRGIVSDKDHVESHQSLKETLAEASLTAGGKNVLINDGEQVLEGAKVQGDSGVVLKGSKTSVLAARLRNMQSDYEYHEDTFTNSTDADGHDNITHEHSKIISNGEISIDSDTIEADYTRKFKEKSSIFGSTFGGLESSSSLDINKPAWAKQVEASGKTVQWNPLTDSSKSWSVHQEVLNPEFSALVSLAATVGTMWAGGFGLFAAEGASVSLGTAMGQSAITGLASSGAVSMVNNKFDLGKVASDLASPDSLYHLGLNSLTAGLTFGASQGLGIEQIKPGLELIDRAEIVAKNGLVGIGVRGALSSGTGDKLGNIIKDETLSGGLALGQSVVGDIAQSKNFATGSIEKTTLHALTGSAYSSLTGSGPISGAIGGASSELVAGIMESGSGVNGPPLTKEEQQTLNNNIKATTKLTSATVTLLAGGNAKDITLSANVGESAIQHNLMGHRNKEDDAKVAQLTDEEVQEQYKNLSENSGATSWLFYNPYEVALEAEHHKRFDSGLDTSIKGQLSLALNLNPLARSAGAIVEKTTGLDLGVSSQITEPDLTGSRLNIPGKGTNVMKVTGSEKLQTKKSQPQLKAEKMFEVSTKPESLTSKSRVRNVNNRKPINSKYADKVYPLEKLPEDLRQKYPHSVPFNGAGYPDFSRYAIKKVQIKVTGKYDQDFSLADKAAGFAKRPEGYTWHHHQDGNSMYLVPTDLHNAVKHTGGIAQTKSK